jgi:hypothetical protein
LRVSRRAVWISNARTIEIQHGASEPRPRAGRTRPSLSQRDGAALIQANDVERVLPDINADHGGCGLHCLKHGVLLASVPSPAYLLTGQEHGRTLPLADLGSRGDEWQLCAYVGR